MSQYYMFLALMWQINLMGAMTISAINGTAHDLFMAIVWFLFAIFSGYKVYSMMQKLRKEL